MLEELRAVKDRVKCAKAHLNPRVGKIHIGNAVDYCFEAIALLDALIAGQGWQPIDDEARAGHVVDVYFMKNGKYVHSRTSYLIEE